MTDTNRVKRWRDAKRDRGLKAVTVWLSQEEELRLKDIALQWHCSPSTVMQRALAQVTPNCNGLQSKPAGPAISAFLGPHLVHLSPWSGPHYLHLRLQSSAWSCNPSRQDHIICN
jgi:hypothetical protein